MRIRRQCRLVGGHNVLAGTERSLNAVGRRMHAAEGFHDDLAIAIDYLPDVGGEEMMADLLRTPIEVAHGNAHDLERFRVGGELLIDPISDGSKSEKRNSNPFLFASLAGKLGAIGSHQS